MTWTTAGFAALVNADNTGTLPVECKYIALGAGTTAASAADTALENEIKRIETISGTVVDNNIIHVVLRDETSDTYQATEVGLIAADGTLLARYAQANPLIVKAAGAVALLAIDASFTDVDATQISFGDIQFINPPWGENTQGVVQKATQAQAEAGTDNNTGMTPRRTLQLLRGNTAQASTTERGSLALATPIEGLAGNDNLKAIVASVLHEVLNANVLGMNQTWQDVTATRSLETKYTNNSGRPIQVAVTTTNVGSNTNYIPMNNILDIFVDDMNIYSSWSTGSLKADSNGIIFGYGQNEPRDTAIFIVPAGSTYEAIGDSTDMLVKWFELR